MSYPPPIQSLISRFSSLPGLGPKTAERLVFYLLKKNNKNDFIEFANSLLNVGKTIMRCELCGNYSEKPTCPICQNQKRDKTKICLVAEAQDIIYLEKTNRFNGRYHVLNGLLDPANGLTPDKLNIDPLFQQLSGRPVSEIIFGLNPTVEGESTIIYLKKILSNQYPQLKLTRLSRGLPMGADLEYADEVTLANAINNRSAA